MVSFKFNSILSVCLAIGFLFFFQFTKHDPVLAAIMPFGNDPYDAVGSFGVIIAGLLSILSVMRAFRRTPTERQKMLLARTQWSVAAAVVVTLVADSVAMVRHIPMWSGRAGAMELLVLMAGMLVLTLLLSLAIRFSIRDIPLAAGSWKKAMMISIIAIAVLALYPESVIQTTVGELCTLLAGILLLFVPLSELPAAFIPFNVESPEADETPRRMGTRKEWGTMALLGLGVGMVLLVGQWSVEGAPVTPALKILIASIFILAPIVGILIAYYSLRKPLALFRYRR